MAMIRTQTALSALVLALATPAIANPSDANAAEGEVIVVTGTPLKATKKALEDCLARGCPPEEDMKLSLAHAENLFVNGDYKDGRKTLKKSLGRNKRYGKDLPVPVSNLHRADARISEHLGEAKGFQLATLDSRDVLRRSFGKDDARVLIADIEVGDSRAKLGHVDEALDIYDRVEKSAIAKGQNRVATYARVRKALIWQSRFAADKRPYQRRELEEQLDIIRNQPLPGAEEFALLADVIQARLDRSSGSGDSSEALIKRFAATGKIDRPVLLFSKPLSEDPEAPNSRKRVRADNALARLTTPRGSKPQWADIGFWIDRDGHVTDVDVLRTARDTGWLKPIVKNISTRVYAPISEESDRPGFYMVERYTLTASLDSNGTGTRLKLRNPYPRIVRTDITAENYQPPIGATDGSEKTQ